MPHSALLWSKADSETEKYVISKYFVTVLGNLYKEAAHLNQSQPYSKLLPDRLGV
ncbi:MAG: hypothetical protein H6Q71_1540 [Firmicutes bacterium]|nr:hypothetical protein [Bacillota bacterium]